MITITTMTISIKLNNIIKIDQKLMKFRKFLDSKDIYLIKVQINNIHFK